MNSQQSIEERLWEYIDGACSAQEKSTIDKFLQEDEQWKHVFEELMDIKQMLASSELEQPSLRFVKNVMEKIPSYNISPLPKKYINKKIIWAIGAIFMILITGFLIYGFAQIEWTSTTKTNFPIDFSKINFSKYFNNTYAYIFMMINVVLGLMLLDRFVASKKE